MPTFKVYVTQWVEEVASIEVDANTVEEAIEIAMDEDFDWRDGTASFLPEATKVRDADGKVVWRKAEPEIMKVWITLDKVDGSRSVVKGPIWLDEINTHGMLFYLNQADVVGITFTSADAFHKIKTLETPDAA